MIFIKLKPFEIALFIGLFAAVLIGGANAQSQKLADSIVRLHVVANSDTDEDQALKLEVRDRVIEITSSLNMGSDAQHAQIVLRENVDEIETAVRQMVQEKGYDYPVTVTLGTENFDTRVYDTFSLPAGQYTSLRVTIGDGAGKNWWCVVFPPICMASCSEELTSQAMAVGLDEGDVALITGDNQIYVLKFKLLELVQSVKMMYNGK
ncbi:MAG: stage II sporulation protein R [Ruminococcaceae bacterium]|nr:stage II sporulation protein R [Oscillospiraceae bacterium]